MPVGRVDGDPRRLVREVQGVEGVDEAAEAVELEHVDALIEAHLVHFRVGHHHRVGAGLVGDAGGAYTLNPPPVDFNVVMMLDVSGSMSALMTDGRTRLDHMVDAVENLLTDFNGYNNGEIMVHLVPFATVAIVAVFTVVDQSKDRYSLLDASPYVL